ncbi:hypothetical protein Daus18300_011602 [Diaporthe australafricana]|uniref:Uncharacterized protein n=1 Tax=Diaporthe australafricana TaxID=127596 RepID=A0ABR3W5X8_9PEZI
MSNPFLFYFFPGETCLKIYEHCLVLPISNTTVQLPAAQSSTQARQTLAQFTTLPMRDEVFV